jgi:hypothetical protein
VVAASLIEAGDKVRAARPGCSATDGEPTSELCLAGGRECRPFLVTDADPFDFAVTDCVGERIKRVANETKYVPDANLFEHVDQGTGHRL